MVHAIEDRVLRLGLRRVARLSRPRAGNTNRLKLARRAHEVRDVADHLKGNQPVVRCGQEGLLVRKLIESVSLFQTTSTHSEQRGSVRQNARGHALLERRDDARAHSPAIDRSIRGVEGDLLLGVNYLGILRHILLAADVRASASVHDPSDNVVEGIEVTLFRFRTLLDCTSN